MKPRIVVLEGMRGSGKTLIATRLSEVLRGFRFPVIVAKWERSETPWEDMENQLKSMMDFVTMGNVVIVDRFHFTEAVMRTADGTQPYLDMLLKAVNIQFMLEDYGGITLWLNCPPSLATERIRVRNDRRGLEPANVPFVWDQMMLSAMNGSNTPISIAEIDASRNEVEVLESVLKELMK